MTRLFITSLTLASDHLTSQRLFTMQLLYPAKILKILVQYPSVV